MFFVQFPESGVCHPRSSLGLFSFFFFFSPQWKVPPSLGMCDACLNLPVLDGGERVGVVHL